MPEAQFLEPLADSVDGFHPSDRRVSGLTLLPAIAWVEAVPLLAMNDQITLTLNRQDLHQLLEGLSERAENWEEISEALRAAQRRREERGGPKYCPESSFAGLAAVRIANDYRKVMDKILEQTEGILPRRTQRTRREG